MCSGDRLLADFVVGIDTRPDLPEVVEQHLVPTADGQWVVWAYKLARQVGDLFVPLRGGSGYPADARATCRFGGILSPHDAPDPDCTCGFHALSRRNSLGLSCHGFSMLTVALSGRVLAFQWDAGGVLWRAERQTVVRIEQPVLSDWAEFDQGQGAQVLGSRRHPGDPDGRLAAVRPAAPRDSGPIRLKLPVSAPVLPLCDDDAGWCVGLSAPEHTPAFLVRA